MKCSRCRFCTNTYTFSVQTLQTVLLQEINALCCSALGYCMHCFDTLYTLSNVPVLQTPETAPHYLTCICIVLLRHLYALCSHIISYSGFPQHATDTFSATAASMRCDMLIFLFNALDCIVINVKLLHIIIYCYVKVLRYLSFVMSKCYVIMYCYVSVMSLCVCNVKVPCHYVLLCQCYVIMYCNVKVLCHDVLLNLSAISYVFYSDIITVLLIRTQWCTGKQNSRTTPHNYCCCLIRLRQCGLGCWG